MRRQTLSLALLIPLAACPPQLAGAPCALSGASANDCPSGQACVSADDGGGVCVEGATFENPDGGDAGVPDAGRDAGEDAGLDAGPDAGLDGGGDGGIDAGPAAVFAGTVVLNGGALPVRNTWVYGFQSLPVFGPGGSITNDVFFTTADAGGDWAVGGAVTANAYYFAAQYDIAATGNSQTVNKTDFIGLSHRVGITESDALSLPIDVETSSCQSFTAQVQIDGGAPGGTVLLGISAQIYDIGKDLPFTSAGDLSVAACDFDAGDGTVPPGGDPSTFTLTPNDAGSWFYGSAGTSVTDQGSFAFRFIDTNIRTPAQYPNGSCVVGYGKPPGFPTNVAVSHASSLGDETVSWTDPTTSLPLDTTLLGDAVTVTSASGTVIYTTPAGQYDQSGVTIPSSAFTNDGCSSLLAGKGMCIVEVLSLFSVIPDPRTAAFEGAAAFVTFQTP